MANVLKMAKIQSIQQLHAAGWSQRRIARELEIDRGTVARYLRSAPSDPNAAIVPAGSDGPNAATFSALPAPAAEPAAGNDGADCAPGSNPAILPAGSRSEILTPAARSASSLPRGRPGQCEPYRERIETSLDHQLTQPAPQRERQRGQRQHALPERFHLAFRLCLESFPHWRLLRFFPTSRMVSGPVEPPLQFQQPPGPRRRLASGCCG